MGYTHTIKQNRAFTPAEWTSITGAWEAIKAHCKSHDIDLDDETDNVSIHFNGSQEKGEDYETCTITQELWDRTEWCKTNRNPYDLAVCLILMACKHFAPGSLTVSSDGNKADWEPARDSFVELFKAAVPSIAYSPV